MNWEAWFRLSRLGGAPTALSASLAGALLGPYPIDISLLACLCISLGLYTLGMVSNDVLDIEKDRRLRPDRVLASGLISKEHALLFLALLMLGITLLSCFLRPQQRFCFGLCAIFILLYNGPLKSQFWLSSACIGMARSLNFFGAYGPVQFGAIELYLFLIIFCHILLIMLIAQGEDESAPLAPSAWIAWALQISCVAILCKAWVMPWMVWTGGHLWMYRNSNRQLRPKLVGLLVASLTLLEACVLISKNHLIPAALLLGLYVFGKTLRRKYPVG